MKIIVTGASGFIGSSLCKYLHNRGHNVTGVVRTKKRAKNLIEKNIKYIVGDITDYDSIHSCFTNIDVIFHLAALFNNPELTWHDYIETNVKGTGNVLKAALEHDVHRVIHCSTVGVATENHGKISSEKSAYSVPEWDKYESTKKEAEELAIKFHKEKGLPLVVIRPAQVYGPGDKGKVKLYKMIKKGIFVNPGNTKKHLIYIDDLCRAFELSIVNKNAIGEIFIIGGKKPVFLKDLVKIISKELQVPLPKISLPAKPITWLSTIIEYSFNLINVKPPVFRRGMDFFTKSVHFEVGKAKRILNFESEIDVKNGISNTAKWYKKERLLLYFLFFLTDNFIAFI